MTGPHDHDQPTRPSGADDRTLGLPSTDQTTPANLVVSGFTIGEKLGEGGMGVVFLAQQHHPSRPVALKVIRGGPVADPLRLRLFRREADTLARLQHPGIAAIYEVGATASGQHYLAMELVQGPTLAAWLREATTPFGRDDLRRRLGMAAAICHAVHYAHQRGVIHRDLKPANLVVQPSETDAPPDVKILDFGLARVIDTDEFQQTMLSQPGTMAGTLPYMSPEQARGDTAAVDVRSDVYALGVILQEMLTGALPYETSRTSIVDAVRSICEAPPRNLRDGWLGPGRPDTDLQTIVSKALAKDADERYASAAALAEDLERYLTSQPILARPPSTMYQLRKLVARRKAPFAAAAVILALLIVGAVGMSGLYVRAEHNLKRAVAAEQAARKEAETANRTADFLVDIFGSSDPTRTSGETVTARQILDTGAERVATELADEPLMQARMMHVIGAVYRQLALNDQARELVEGSLVLRRATLDPDDPDLARSLGLLAQIYQDLGDDQRTRATYMEALAFWDRVERNDTDDLPTVLAHYGWYLGEAKEFAAAERNIRRALDLVRSAPGDPGARLIPLLSNLASVKMNDAQVDTALIILDEALAAARRIYGDVNFQTADVLSNQAIALDYAGRPAEAEVPAREALTIRETIYGPDHPLVAKALSNLAICVVRQGRLADARPLFERALDVQIRNDGPDHPAVAQAENNLGRLTMELGDLDAAKPLLDRALATRERVYGKDHPIVALTLYNLGDYHARQGEPEQALAALERMLAIDEAALGPDHPDLVEDLDAMLPVLRTLGLEDRARAYEARMAEIMKEAGG